MNNKIQLLACVFALQLLVALVVLWSGEDSSSFKPERLIAAEKETIDRILISDSDSEVELIKKADRWEFSAPAALPVDASRMNSLLTQLTQLETGWPVATTTSSHERFEVSENKFNRKISVYAKENKLTEILVGTSPGFKKSHIRQMDHDDVYALEFNAYEASASDQDWLDKSLLALPSVKRIKGSDFELLKEDDTWSWSGAPLTAEVDQEKAKVLSEALKNLRVSAVATELPTSKEVKSLSIESEEGDSYTFELFAQENDYFIKRSGIAQVFTLSQFEYERLSEPALDSLSVAQAANDDSATESISDSSDFSGS